MSDSLQSILAGIVAISLSMLFFVTTANVIGDVGIFSRLFPPVMGFIGFVTGQWIFAAVTSGQAGKTQSHTRRNDRPNNSA